MKEEWGIDGQFSLKKPTVQKKETNPPEISARAGLWSTGISKSNTLLTTVNCGRDFPTQKYDVKRKPFQERGPSLIWELLQASYFDDVHWWKQSEASSVLGTFQETVLSPTVSGLPQQCFDALAEHQCSMHKAKHTTQGLAWPEAPTRDWKEEYAISWLVTDVASLCIISTHFFTSSAWNNALLY